MATHKTPYGSSELTSPQLVALAAAAQRDDGGVVLPARLKGGAAQSFVAALIGKGLVREIRAKPGMPVCRHDPETGQAYALVITKLGRAAIPAAQNEPAPSNASAVATAATTASSARTKKSLGVEASPPPAIQRCCASPDAWQTPPSAAPAIVPNGPETDAIITEVASKDGGTQPANSNPPRQGSKLADVLALLFRENGAGIEELTTATGWLPHTTRAALTGLRKRGYEILRESSDGKGSIYRIEFMPCAEAA